MQVAVRETDIEAAGRNDISNSDPVKGYFSTRIIVCCLFISLAIIGLGVGLGIGLTKSPAAQPLAPLDSLSGGNSSALDSFSFRSTARSRQFKYLSYDEIVQRLRFLKTTFPNLVDIYTAQERFNLPSAGRCTIDGNLQQCQVWILVVGNRTLQTSRTPEVFLSGTVHGDERVGPTAVVEFASALLEMYASSSWARALVDSRAITVVPAANALGYDQNVREENGVDVNRDFAWNQAPQACMVTVAARVINELFRRHAFQLGLTFHGGDSMISFPWGDFLHCKAPGSGQCGGSAAVAPDHTGMAALAAALRNFAGAFGPDGAYATGILNDIIYAVNGGMEDWAYAASWAPGGGVACAGGAAAGYGAARTTGYGDGTNRAVNLLVETATEKAPAEAGLGASGPGLLDPGGAGFAVEWRVGGALRLDAARLDCAAADGGPPPPPCAWGEPPPAPRELWAGGLPASVFASRVVLPAAATGRSLSVRISVQVDQAWAAADRFEAGRGPPQSHLVRARTDAGWRAASSEGVSVVEGAVWWASDPFTVSVLPAALAAASTTAPAPPTTTTAAAAATSARAAGGG